MNDEPKARSGLARLEQTVETTTDHFKDFKGFGSCGGAYLGFERKDVSETARGILELHRGEIVRVSYNNIAPTEYRPINKYSQRDIFHPVENWKIDVPRKGSLERMFSAVNTDNMRLEFLEDTIEIQKIVIGEQYVSEIRLIKQDNEWL
ncbi:MAG: hypothetical protein Q8O89_01330 [Nanoarchaeota archaeon]|nr:hypothetical protein [Nanoarchaeota archaeon]